MMFIFDLPRPMNLSPANVSKMNFVSPCLGANGDTKFIFGLGAVHNSGTVFRRR